jgi:hypothetical protein
MEDVHLCGRRKVPEGDSNTDTCENKTREGMNSDGPRQDTRHLKRRMVVINCWISPSLTEGRRNDCYSIHDPSLLTKRSDFNKKDNENRTRSAKM